MKTYYEIKETQKYNINDMMVILNQGLRDMDTNKVIRPFIDTKSNTQPNTSITASKFNPLEAIVIQNVSLYEREKSRRQLTETLYQIGCALCQTLDLETLLELVLRYLAEIIPYDQAAVMLKNGDELEVVATKGFPTAVHHSQLGTSLKGNNVFQQICYTRLPLLIPDVWQHPHWQQTQDLSPGRAWLGVPLICSNQVIGILSLTRKCPGVYINDQVKLVAKFARQAAIALENARLYEKVARFAQQLEDVVYERTQALQAVYAQLEYIDETKSDFVSIAAHELRTPLTSLQGYSQMLFQNAAIKENPHLLELISSIHSSSLRLCEVINTILDVAKIDSQTLELYPEPVSLFSLIEQVAQKFEKSLAERKHTLAVTGLDKSLLIEADANALTQVFCDLIANAIKYTPDGGTITISGHYDEKQQSVEIVISDTGIGIDPEFQELIFTKFYRADDLALHSTGKTKFKGAGPGLGLTIARGIIEMHQGKIWVESLGYDEQSCPGSQFHIWLPLHSSN